MNLSHVMWPLLALVGLLPGNRVLAANRSILLSLAVVAAACINAPAAEEGFAWQRDYARVTETGDIQWTPREFRFETEGEVRFIDYENGSDDKAGTSKEQPWKHHPWDANAVGKAAAARGILTCVFKGGVTYRGQLTVKEHGRPGHPVRLTRDPNWGTGPAILAGSQRVTGWTRGADRPDIPEPESVWKAKLDFAPRTLWTVSPEGQARRVPLARHPNWSSQPEDHKGALCVGI